MATKRLGRLRQWADEVINAKEKTTLTGEAKEVEQEIELRKDGLQRLQLAAEQYHKSISKKRVSHALDDPDKFLPREAFGTTMVRHGEDFAEDSLLGQVLIIFGRAFCNIATAQEALGRSLGSSLIVSLQRFLDQVKDYEAEKKKLETRRLNRDAAMKQVERVENNKKAKEKDRREAQEELEKSEFRYDEAEADVHSRIEAIQQNEIDQIRVLGSFLDIELSYAEQYIQILRDVKDNWPGKQEIAKLMDARRFIGPMYDFSRERAESPRPKIRSRASSNARARSRSSLSSSADSETDDEPPPPRSRKSSTGSMRSRKRSDSQTTTGSAVEAARDRKEKEEKKKGSWSVWSRNGSKRDREQFTSLRGTADDESDSSDPERAPGSPTQASKSASLLSLGKWSKSQQSISTPRIPALGSRTRGRDSERQKVVRATSDYLGSSDELSFRTGDEIVVVGEVVDGWMMGQLDGKKGLFPTVYTERISAASRRSQSKPSVAPTPALLQSSRQTLIDSDSFTSSSSRLGPRAVQAQVGDSEGEGVDDSSHPFGDHHATTQDTDHEQGPPSSAAPSSSSGFPFATIRRALQKARQMSRSRRSHVSYAGVRVMTMNGSFGTSITSAVGTRKKCPRPCHADKRRYAKHHLHLHRRVGRIYVHHHNRRMDYWTVRPGIARTLCRRWDAPRECVRLVKGCISNRAASQMFKLKRGFVHIPSYLYQDYVHSLPLLYRIIPIPPI
ncbi:hypothetical protein BGY98DRAFT_740303 [Russula aff. rugulosa BPL654]|nr:hypothetical protein BGY98DRAFT_740303 [Russula aff. rugulosa BPL654]